MVEKHVYDFFLFNNRPGNVVKKLELSIPCHHSNPLLSRIGVLTNKNTLLSVVISNCSADNTYIKMSEINLVSSSNVSKSVSKGEEHAGKETLDFSGRGLKLDTEADGN